MALFKIYRGNEFNEDNQDLSRVPLKDGNAYFTQDTHNFYIDYDENGELKRSLSGVGKNTIEGGEIFNNYDENIADNKNSHAEGSKTEATGENAHAQNRKAKAYGKHSHAQNYDTLAQGESSTAIGIQTKAYQKGSSAEGVSSIAGNVDGAVDVDWGAHAEGGKTEALGKYSHSEGQFTLANGEASHAEGTSTIAGDNYTHAEGSGAQAYKQASHAEGGSTIAGEIPEGVDGSIPYPENGNHDGGSDGTGSDGSGDTSEKDWGAHAEGLNTRALAMAAHAEGEMTKADRYAAHAEGIGTIAHTTAQHVQGKYNVEDIEHIYAHIVGNGTSYKEEDRKNIHTVDWNGNAWFAGDISVGINNDKLVKTSEIENLTNLKEDKSNKTTSLSSSSTDTQYPSAKSVVNYVKQVAGSVYDFMGSINLEEQPDSLPQASSIGKGAVYNIGTGSGTITLQDYCGRLININDETISLPNPIPLDGLISISFINEDTMEVRTAYPPNIILKEYDAVNKIYTYYVYDALGSLFSANNANEIWYAHDLQYTLSYAPGDNIISTGSYWDNFGSYIDLSNYATKADLVQLENNLKAYINEIILGGEW